MNHTSPTPFDHDLGTAHAATVGETRSPSMADVTPSNGAPAEEIRPLGIGATGPSTRVTTDHAGHGESHPTPLQRLYLLLRPELSDIWVVTVFAAVVGVLGLATPVAVEALVNTIAFGRLVQPLAVLSLILLVFLAFNATLRGMQAYIAEVIQRRLFVRVVADLTSRLPRVRHEAFDDAHGPELLNRFFDVMTVQKTAALLVLDGIGIVLQTTIGMAVLAFYHPYLLGFDLFLLSAIAFVVFVLGRGAIKTSITESYAKYAVASWLEQLAQFSTTFKLDGGRRALERADRLTAEYIRARRFHFRILLRQMAVALAMQAIAATMLLGLGGWLVMQGQLTLGQLVAAELIIAVIVGGVAKLGKQMESFYDLLAAVDKIGHLIDLPVEREKAELPPRGPSGATVRLQQVRYAYRANDFVLHQAGAEFHPGEIVAIDGPPASGKTTLLDLLATLRDPAGGYIEFDRVDIRALNLAKLREQISLVRGVEVFSGTLAENLRVGGSDLPSPSLRGILEAVDLWDELMRLPQGLETPLQTGGAPLSGTQAVRLMFARALACQPRLLLIDGALDRLSDRQLDCLFGALQGLGTSTTTVIVTGREAVARRCDRILSMEQIDRKHTSTTEQGS